MHYIWGNEVVVSEQYCGFDGFKLYLAFPTVCKRNIVNAWRRCRRYKNRCMHLLKRKVALHRTSDVITHFLPVPGQDHQSFVKINT